MLDDFFFAFESASHPDGPWRHLRVLEVRGQEAMSSLYSFEIELVRHDDAPDVDVTELPGQRAALRIVTGTQPEHRIVHGIIASAEELGEVDKGTRLRVVLAPPILRATMMRKSLVYLEKTLEQILKATLERTSWGAGLTASSGDDPGDDDGDPGAFKPAQATYALRCIDMERLADAEVRPYCVQYEETDWAFVSRLLEEEGISYHFEHRQGECILVLSDFDGGRSRVDNGALGAGIAGREILHFRAGSRVRPLSASLNDFNWRKPNLNLIAVSPAGVTEFQTHEHPGRYEHSKQTGERLAEKREQRLDTERAFASAEVRSRLLGAGSVFELEHANTRWSGKYLVTAIRHVGLQRGGFSEGTGSDATYTGHIECIRCGKAGEDGESNFRPERVTPRPRILGTQTAIVTADPSTPDAEINVGGPENIGCVRVKFHWDIDSGRHEKEPTSCWIRVSQLFAGASHGAMWHPRVGNEVIVDFLDGDPDRPLVTGRVYNGVNPSPENATQRPTYSAIKSLTSPYDGNYNLIAFEDAQGKEQILIHAARDMDTTVERNASRAVGNDDSTTVAGSQTVSVTGSQSTSAGSISMSGGTTVSIKAGTDLSANAGSNLTASAGVNFVGSAGTNMSLGAGTDVTVVGGSHVTLGAPTIEINGGGNVKVDAPVIDVNGGGNVNVGAPWIDVKGGAKIRAGAAIVEVNGATVLINGSGSISIKGGTVTVEGSTVNVTGGGAVNVKGGVINLNS